MTPKCFLFDLTKAADISNVCKNNTCKNIVKLIFTLLKANNDHFE